MNAISRLTDKAPRRFRFIKKAMDSLPEDKKYDVHALLEKARELITNLAKNTVGAQNTKAIANTLTTEHIVEYIVHMKQQEEAEESTQKERSKQTKQAELD